jgi:hypothetical protein
VTRYSESKKSTAETLASTQGSEPCWISFEANIARYKELLAITDVGKIATLHKLLAEEEASGSPRGMSRIKIERRGVKAGLVSSIKTRRSSGWLKND